MSILADMQRVIKPLGIPIETGVFTDKAPDKYIVVVPLTDTFAVHADNQPEIDVQEARLSLYTQVALPGRLLVFSESIKEVVQ